MVCLSVYIYSVARHVLQIIQFPVLTTPYRQFHQSAYQNNPRGMICALV